MAASCAAPSSVRCRTPCSPPSLPPPRWRRRGRRRRRACFANLASPGVGLLLFFLFYFLHPPRPPSWSILIIPLFSPSRLPPSPLLPRRFALLPVLPSFSSRALPLRRQPTDGRPALTKSLSAVSEAARSILQPPSSRLSQLAAPPLLLLFFLLRFHLHPHGFPFFFHSTASK